ncbi:MAG TPA: hypothetical protein DDW48_04810 [Methyloceanibacter sp.]|nr:hypothetical protein [Methyloceanibacter sp.]
METGMFGSAVTRASSFDLGATRASYWRPVLAVRAARSAFRFATGLREAAFPPADATFEFGL